MSNERYIFTKEELEAYVKYMNDINEKIRQYNDDNKSIDIDKYIESKGAAPLPSPVIVPDDEAIQKTMDEEIFEGLYTDSDIAQEGAKLFRRQIFGF